jgi:hypothetical protein
MAMFLQMQNRRIEISAINKTRYRTRSHAQGFPSRPVSAAEGPPLIVRDL